MKLGLRKEIETMLSLVPGEWKLELHKPIRMMEDPYVYKINGHLPNNLFEHGLVSGSGNTKREALQDLLENWRSGRTASISMPAAPCMNREELRIKLDLLDLDDRDEKVKHDQWKRSSGKNA